MVFLGAGLLLMSELPLYNALSTDRNQPGHRETPHSQEAGLLFAAHTGSFVSPNKGSFVLVDKRWQLSCKQAQEPT